jgi:hypothetical protein
MECHVCVLPSQEAQQMEQSDVGRLLPKHVEASIYNKVGVQICAYCWLFLLNSS